MLEGDCFGRKLDTSEVTLLRGSEFENTVGARGESDCFDTASEVVNDNNPSSNRRRQKVSVRTVELDEESPILRDKAFPVSPRDSNGLTRLSRPPFGGGSLLSIGDLGC